MANPVHWRKHWQRQIIYPSNTGRIVVTYPGLYSTLKGGHGKFEEIAQRISEAGLASVVLCNRRIAWLDLHLTINRMLLKYQLREHMDSILANSKEICGEEAPYIMVVGHSAGAGAAAAIAYKYPNIQKLVLFSPSFDAGKPEVLEGISRYEGELYIVYGQLDVFVGRPTGPKIFEAAKSARFKRQTRVPMCDHGFRGKANREWFVGFPIFVLQGVPLTLE